MHSNFQDESRNRPFHHSQRVTNECGRERGHVGVTWVFKPSSHQQAQNATNPSNRI